MATKPQIKIIKREERNRQESHPQPAEAKRPTAQETARDMVSTVTNWVTEFQQKRRTETSRAFKTLFPEPAQPNEA
jgi:formylglycine-generating enzyme required for sulfatase activity